MSSPSSAAALTADEVVPLQSIPGSGQRPSSKNDSPKGHSRDYRKLAIGSIICGISCIGIFALINSVKAQERSLGDLEKAQVYSHRAWRLSLIAIATWVVLLTLIPASMALASYLLTLID